MAQLTLGSAGEALIKGIEKLELQPYMDEKKIWTIGYGHVIRGAGGIQFVGADQEDQARSIYPNGMSADDAEMQFQIDTQAAVAKVNKVVRVWPTQNQFDAMVSLAFNIGCMSFATSTVAAQHNAGNYAAAADAFLLWDKVREDGELVISAGLAQRRKQERELYLG